MNKKNCTICKQTFDTTSENFQRQKTVKSGLTAACKSCKKNNRKKYLSNKENHKKALSKAREWKNNNKDRCKEKRKQYYLNNKNKEIYLNKIYYKTRRKTDHIFKLITNYRNRVNKVLKRDRKKRGTIEWLGCSPEEFWNHLEKQFLKGMTRENQGQWHVDHIIPLSSAANEDELKTLLHYSNCQPLWAIDNIRKGAKIV